jgi:hypothetical protein
MAIGLMREDTRLFASAAQYLSGHIGSLMWVAAAAS